MIFKRFSKRLRLIEGRLDCLIDDYYSHIANHHDKRQSRIAERNEIAVQILVAHLRCTDELDFKGSIMAADEMMVNLYGKGWDKYDPVIGDEIMEKALASLRRDVIGLNRETATVTHNDL